MQITLTVPDKKADSFLDVLRHVSYVDILPSDTADHSSSTNEDDEEKFSAEEFYENFRGAIHELNEAIAGRIQLQSAKEFLAELRSESVGGI